MAHGLGIGPIRPILAIMCLDARTRSGDVGGMGITRPICLASLLAALLLAVTVPPAAAQPGSRGVSRHMVVPYDSNMSMIDRMARRNMERRHIERRMRLAPPPGPAPRRPSGFQRR